jgi:hypothetical protein
MDFCINCIHFLPKPKDDSHEYARCTRRGDPDPVTGIMKYPYCEMERKSTGTCAEGRHFNQKPENNNEQ